MSSKKDKKSKKATPAPTYKIYVHASDGVNIPAVDRDGNSDPYVLLQLVGGSQKVISRHIENNLNPVWDQALDPLDGFFIGNDVLRIQVVDKDKVQGSPGDDIIGQFDLPLRELPLGVTSDKQISLIRTDSKGKLEKKAKPGSGGVVNLRFSLVWPGQNPWEEAAWGWPFYTAVVKFVSAANLPAADLNGKSDPYVVSKVVPGLNAQKVKTKTISYSLNPVWNEDKTFLLNSGPEDSLTILVYDKDVGTDDDKIGTGSIPFSDFDFAILNEPQEKTYPLKVASGKLKSDESPTLTVAVTLSCNNAGGVPLARGLLATGSVPPPVPAENQEVEAVMERSIEIEGDFSFSWGNFTSSYSTSLDGYTNYANGSISELRDGEDDRHHHPTVEEEVKVKADEEKTGSLVLSGTVVGARGLPKADEDGTDSYVIVNLGNKGGKEKTKVTSELVHDTSDPDWNFPFDLGVVRKGQAVEFTVFQHHKVFAEQPLGYARVDLKNIEHDSQATVEIQLEKPKKFKKPKWEFTTHGTLLVVFNLTVKTE
jgi:Ca2+-dependent lipid-binding protein